MKIQLWEKNEKKNTAYINNNLLNRTHTAGDSQKMLLSRERNGDEKRVGDRNEQTKCKWREKNKQTNSVFVCCRISIIQQKLLCMEKLIQARFHSQSIASLTVSISCFVGLCSFAWSLAIKLQYNSCWM